MLRSVRLSLVVWAVLAALPGCGGAQPKWEIFVENKSNTPCSVYVTLGADGKSDAKVENLARGKSIALIGGETNTVVQSVKVVRGKDVKAAFGKVELPVGHRYSIVIAENGSVEMSVSNE